MCCGVCKKFLQVLRIFHTSLFWKVRACVRVCAHVPFNELVSTYFLNGCLCRTVRDLVLSRECVCVFMHALLNECVNNELGFSV